MLATETAARAYVDATAEPDAGRRADMLARCFSSTARVVAATSRYEGLEAIRAMIDRFVAAGLRPSLTTAIEVQGALFRFGSVAATADGKVVDEFIDVGEVDADGRIACIYVMRA